MLTCVSQEVADGYYTSVTAFRDASLDSILSPEAIVSLAQQHGCPAVALTDVGNLHGSAEFVLAARKAGIRPIVGAEVRVEGDPRPAFVPQTVTRSASHGWSP